MATTYATAAAPRPPREGTRRQDGSRAPYGYRESPSGDYLHSDGRCACHFLAVASTVLPMCLLLLLVILRLHCHCLCLCLVCLRAISIGHPRGS